MGALKIIFLTFFTLVMTFIICLILLWFNLSWVLKPDTLSYLQRRFAPTLQMEWDKINIDVASDGLTDKTFSVASRDSFCGSYKNSNFCFNSIDVAVKIKPFDEPLWQIKKLNIEGQKVLLNLDDFTDPKAPKNPINIQTLIDQLKTYFVLIIKELPEAFSLDFPLIQILSQESTMTIQASLKPEKLSIDLEQAGLKLFGEMSFKDKLQSLSSLRGQFNVLTDASDFIIQLDGQKEDLSLVAAIEMKTQNKETQKKNNQKTKTQKAKIHKKTTYLKANLNLNFDLLQDSSQLTIHSSEIKMIGVTNISINQPCAIQFFKGDEKTTQFDCPQISFSDFNSNKTGEKLKSYGLIPQTLWVAAKGFFNEARLNQKDGSLLGSLSLKLQEIKQKELKLNAHVSADFLSNPNAIQIIPTNVDIKLICDSFRKLIDSFKGTPLTVPAPINTLDGRIEYQFSDASRTDKEVIIKGQGLTRLTGAGQQTLDLEINNSFHLSLNQKQKKHFLGLNVIINKAYFYLPPFDPLAGMPAVTKDVRIQSKEAEKKQKISEKQAQKSNMDYKINVVSKSNNSIRVYYKLFNPYLAMGLKAQVSPDTRSFQINTGESFVIDYMKRQVEVQKINLSQAAETPDKLPIDVRLLYEASGYDIYIDVIGNVDKPRVLLSSRPSVSRSDIISLLLYNRTSSDLNRFENENIGGVQSAITDRALGLFGIWAFASTPIDSVSYDSSSQVYRAQISLPQGIKFDIGTDWEKTRVIGLRKRITENWLVTTGYETTQDEGQTGNMFLQREFTF